MIKNCLDCGDSFEGTFETYCKRCYLKRFYPRTYENKYMVKDIECSACDAIFPGTWQEKCPSCWRVEQQTKEIENGDENYNGEDL